MGLQEDINEIKNEVLDLQEKSLAKELLEDVKKTNKRMFIIIIIILIMWFASIGLFIYYINTTGFETITETAETTDSGNACVGDNCNNGEINYGKGK